MDIKADKISYKFIITNVVKFIKIVIYITSKIIDLIFNIFEGKKVSTVVISTIIFEILIIFSFLFKINNINHAQQALYSVTGTSKEYVEYEYSQKNNFIGDDRLQFKYYIFTAKRSGKTDTKVNFLVNKKDKDVYVCLYDSNKILIPYGYYVDNSSISGRYYKKVIATRYGVLPYQTRIYIERYGSEKFLYTVDEILNNIEDDESNFNCNPLSYVNKVLIEKEPSLES